MRIGIIGGGITGLSCAYYLGRAGIEATVFDPMPGGTIGTVYHEGCVLENGPESWLAAKPWAEQLIKEVGMGDELTSSNDANRRTYVLRHGKFVTLPEGLQLVVPTKVMPIVATTLFTWGTKIRMGLEMLRSPQATPDRSVSDFVRDHFGDEAVEYLAEPLLAGVYGGSPDNLSAASVLPKFVEYEQKYGSVVVGALRTKIPKPAAGRGIFLTLKRGMGSLVEELESRVHVLPLRVDGLAKGETGWGIRSEGEWYPFDQVVVACGANHAVGLVSPHDERLGELLGQIPHSSSEIWTLGFRKEDISHPLDAFGFLVPRKERKVIMSCTWLNTKWAGRVPDDKVVLRCFSTHEGVTREAVLDELGHLMGIKAEPIFALHQRWNHAMPQYTVGHARRAEEIQARFDAIPGLHFAGNALSGVGIPDCIRSARQAAGGVVEGLTTS